MHFLRQQRLPPILLALVSWAVVSPLILGWMMAWRWRRRRSSITPRWAARSTFHLPLPGSEKYFNGRTGDLRTLRLGDYGASCARAFDAAFRVFAERPCIGRRAGPGKPFEWCTYESFHQDVRSVAAGLAHALPPGSNVVIYPHEQTASCGMRLTCSKHTRRESVPPAHMNGLSWISPAFLQP